MQSQATTVKDYLAELPRERRVVLEAVRKAIRKNLPKGYAETMTYGMIGYVVPLKVYPQGYLDNPKVPLCYVGLAAQKNYFAVYLTNTYMSPKSRAWFEKAYTASGKKMDIGKSCVRFKKLEDLPLEVIGEAVAMTPMKDYIKLYESGRTR